MADTYTLIVTDAEGQTTTVPIVLTNAKPMPRANITSFTRTSSCGAVDGSVTVTPSDGIPPYEFSLDLVNWQTSGTFNNLASGVYQFFARDANGCIANLIFGGRVIDINPTNCQDFDVMGTGLTPYICGNTGYMRRYS